MPTLCPKCDHLPSCRSGSRKDCACDCHDAADAAPALLAACKAMLAWGDREAMPQGGRNDAPWEKMEAAIALAEGKSA